MVYFTVNWFYRTTTIKGLFILCLRVFEELTALLPDYNIAGHESILGGMFAGIVGVLVVIGLYMLIHRYHEKHTGKPLESA